MRADACLSLFVRGLGFFVFFLVWRPRVGRGGFEPGLKKASRASRRLYFSASVSFLLSGLSLAGLRVMWNVVVVVFEVVGAVRVVSRLLTRVASVVRAFWAAGMVPLCGMAPR